MLVVFWFSFVLWCGFLGPNENSAELFGLIRLLSRERPDKNRFMAVILSVTLNHELSTRLLRRRAA